MLNFLLNENVLSVAPICGFFTSHILISLKTNILDPLSYKLFPENFFGDSIDSKKLIINWKMFLKDLVLWIIVMFVFYIIWVKLLKRFSH
jgi:large-conductance mechanosensitive channel